MKTNRTFLLVLLVILCSIHTTAQTYYYYYKGSKIPLTRNESKVVVNVPKGNEEISERICSNIQILVKTEDQMMPGKNYFDMLVISRSEFEKLTSMEFWKEDAKSVILTYYYFTEKNAEALETPFIDVWLKKAEDADLLTPYVEKYKLINYGRYSEYLPLVYVLILTPETEKNSLDIANEMYVSGDFKSAEPTLSSPTIPDEIQVRHITSKTMKESSGIYDLQGRRLNGKPTKGVYIESGRKTVVR